MLEKAMRFLIEQSKPNIEVVNGIQYSDKQLHQVMEKNSWLRH